MKIYVLIIIVSLLLLINGCATSREINVSDEKGNPIPDVFVIINECNMLPPSGSNKQIIKKTDSSGTVKFSLFGLINYYIGKKGFYPASGSTSKNTPLSIVLHKKGEKMYLSGEFQRVIQGRKSVYDIAPSPFWNDWQQYVNWLKEKGYFDKK